MDLLIVIAILILIVSYAAGWYTNYLKRQFTDIYRQIGELTNRKVEKPTYKAPPSKSMVLDPDDVFQQAKLEQERISRELNGE